MSTGMIIALASGGGVAIILAVVILILVSFTKSRTKRADTATDQMVTYSDRLHERAAELTALAHANATEKKNVKVMEEVIARKDVELGKQREQFQRDANKIRELIELAGKDARAHDVLALIRSAHAELVRNVDGVHPNAAGQAVPGTAAASQEGGDGDAGAGVREGA